MSAISNRIRVIEEQTPHHREKGLMPKMMEMMDQLTITPTEPDVANHQQSEPRGNVVLGSNNLVSTPETPWSDQSHCPFYACEFCGHRPPHEQLMILHSHSHLDNHRMQVRREMYAKLDSIGQMVTDMRSIHLDDGQRCQEAMLYNGKPVGGKKRPRRRPRP